MSTERRARWGDRLAQSGTYGSQEWWDKTIAAAMALADEEVRAVLEDREDVALLNALQDAEEERDAALAEAAAAARTAARWEQMHHDERALTDAAQARAEAAEAEAVRLRVAIPGVMVEAVALVLDGVWPMLDDEASAQEVARAADAWRKEGGQRLAAALLAPAEATTDHDGCDCTELCSMGPTCPGASLARLPKAGCWEDRVVRCKGCAK